LSSIADLEGDEPNPVFLKYSAFKKAKSPAVIAARKVAHSAGIHIVHGGVVQDEFFQAVSR
jgi:hypothetical protein